MAEEVLRHPQRITLMELNFIKTFIEKLKDLVSSKTEEGTSFFKTCFNRLNALTGLDTLLYSGYFKLHFHGSHWLLNARGKCTVTSDIKLTNKETKPASFENSRSGFYQSLRNKEKTDKYWALNAVVRHELDVLPVQSGDSTDRHEGVVVSQVEREGIELVATQVGNLSYSNEKSEARACEAPSEASSSTQPQGASERFSVAVHSAESYGTRTLSAARVAIPSRVH
ncbi:hypothetical protein K2173_027063 [Erythroxylum novogranatense]|uniref:Uncharacterized protein n=1 Tax=Erythroxylum novogranatense TaxID=1862640 RepID=A0AAV8TZE7_9ROSI|nr:hypothetical protein K2173_027063 [Erythroxylum novogranatense]